MYMLLRQRKTCIYLLVVFLYIFDKLIVNQNVTQGAIRPEQWLSRDQSTVELVEVLNWLISLFGLIINHYLIIRLGSGLSLRLDLLLLNAIH